MLKYKPALFGLLTLFFICVIYNITVDSTDNKSILIFLALIYFAWLLYCAYYCIITVPKYYTKGSKFSENFVSFLNGLFAGPFGLIFNYNMNRAYKGYFPYIVGGIYGMFALGNLFSLIQVI